MVLSYSSFVLHHIIIVEDGLVGSLNSMDDNSASRRQRTTHVDLNGMSPGDRRHPSTSSAASVQSSDSAKFSDTQLGRMLAQKGLQAPDDFEVPQQGQRQRYHNLVGKVMTRRHSSERRRGASKKGSSTTATAKSPPKHGLRGPQLDEQEQVLFTTTNNGKSNPGIILIDDRFQDEPPSERSFDGDDLYLSEFGDGDNAMEGIIAPSTHSRWMAEHAATPADSTNNPATMPSYRNDWYHLEAATLYRDAPRSPAKRFTDSLRSMRSSLSPTKTTAATPTTPWSSDTADPYRDNLQPCDLDALDSEHQAAAANSYHYNKLRNQRRWWWFLMIMSVVGLTVGLPLTIKHARAHGTDDDTEISAAGGSTGLVPPSSKHPLHVVHTPDDPTDTRFAHDWSDKEIDNPVTAYALHPVRHNTKLLIEVTAPYAGDTTLYLKYGLEATLRTGDVGCGDLAYRTVAAGATTTVKISGETDTQIVACVFDTVVATTHHLMVPAWEGVDKVRHVTLVARKKIPSRMVSRWESRIDSSHPTSAVAFFTELSVEDP